MLRIVLDAGVVQLHDSVAGTALAEPAVVAVDPRQGLPFRAGWAALHHDRATWPLEHLALADLEPDPEPRRCLLSHLLRSALSNRSWWNRILCPAVTLVVPQGLSTKAIQVLRSDAAFAGSARKVRVEEQATDGTAAPARPLATD